MSCTQNEILDEIAKSSYTDDNGDYLRCLNNSTHKNCKNFIFHINLLTFL